MTPYMREQLAKLTDLMDVVDKDMKVYDMTGIMDVPAQNAALVAAGAVLDQLAEEAK